MKTIFDRLLIGVNSIVLVTLGVLLLRPGGMIRSAVREHLIERRVKTYLAERWDSLTNGAPVLTGPDSAVDIVLFSDYECPACRSSFKRYDGLSTKTAELGIALRHLPLSSHPNAGRAAAAAICADRQGRFKEMNQLLFTASLDSFGLAWSRASDAAGLPDQRAFLACMEDATTTDKLAVDSSLAAFLGINGTPTYVTRAGRFPGALTADQLVWLAKEARSAN